MRYVHLVRRVTLLMFDKLDSPNYSASCQITINGDRALVDSLNGVGFYQLFNEHGITPFTSLGIRTLYMAVSAAHLRLIRRALRAHPVVINVTGKSHIGQLTLEWVEISSLERRATDHAP